MINKITYFIIIIALNSCAGSSEIISMSSRNLKKNERIIIGSLSMNPTIMPLCHEEVDTIKLTSKRIFGNYNNPMNPILSGNFMYGMTDYYEMGFGADISLIGFTLIMNNKIGFSDLINNEKEKKIGFSYYNKSTFSRGLTAFPASYDPFKKGHFEIGNYFLIGIFFRKFELILVPHIDFNYLMSKEYESFYISNGSVVESCNTFYNDENSLMSRITNKDLSFFNYGLNVALKTKNNFFFEAGFQYIDAQTVFFEPIRKSRYQFSLGIGYSLKLNKLGLRNWENK